MLEHLRAVLWKHRLLNSCEDQFSSVDAQFPVRPDSITDPCWIADRTEHLRIQSRSSGTKAASATHSKGRV
jgi:hypothetical protein